MSEDPTVKDKCSRPTLGNSCASSMMRFLYFGSKIQGEFISKLLSICAAEKNKEWLITTTFDSIAFCLALKG